MNFDKESKSEEIFFVGMWGGGGQRERERKGRGEERDSNRTNTIGIRSFFVPMLYIKFQVPGSNGSLVLTQTKGVTDR